jgi:hypothetical protein
MNLEVGERVKLKIKTVTGEKKEIIVPTNSIYGE